MLIKTNYFFGIILLICLLIPNCNLYAASPTVEGESKSRASITLSKASIYYMPRSDQLTFYTPECDVSHVYAQTDEKQWFVSTHPFPTKVKLSELTLIDIIIMHDKENMISLNYRLLSENLKGPVYILMLEGKISKTHCEIPKGNKEVWEDLGNVTVLDTSNMESKSIFVECKE